MVQTMSLDSATAPSGRHLRIEGHARVDTSIPPADQNPEYIAKYAERIGALFGTAAEFAALFALPIVITHERVIA